MPEVYRSPLQEYLTALVAASGRTRDSFDTELRKLLDTTGKPLWDIERGKVKRPSPRVLRAIESVFGLRGDSLVDIVHPRTRAFENDSEAGHRSDRPEQPQVRSADSGETAPVMRLDLSYSMGAGSDLDSSYVDSEAFEFDIAFLRSMTITPADRIRIVDGIGDSMQPTLHDRDLLFIDVNQTDLNAQDRIWAMWLFGLGAVKRLRAIDENRVMVISDNPDVENQIVDRSNIMIHGRVIGSIKRH
ncbi:hypothetical protein ASE75_06150 [Sphingomonas sp. Leaf17]|uniref:S24 family peptidase n=1 Tax=Sphingomonas sp. Leaf17 TaxID=1735683 RepID=UPI000701EF41|nr:S24 family peptidase [Sphingomonas sp. Leaf17]KQM65808.1 hypothetical protein ASE75_06150 [Sphingomonas sp. Leaf17]